MWHYLIHRWPFAWVDLKHLSHERFTCIAHIVPDLAYKLQWLPILLTEGCQGSGTWQLAELRVDQGIEHHSKAPDVRRARVYLVSEDLRSHIRDAALLLRRFFKLGLIKAIAEVTKLNRDKIISALTSFNFRDKDVRLLDVTVHESLSVHLTEHIEELSDYMLHLGLWKCLDGFFRHVFKKAAFLSILRHLIDNAIVWELLDQTHHVLVTV